MSRGSACSATWRMNFCNLGFVTRLARVVGRYDHLDLDGDDEAPTSYQSRRLDSFARDSHQLILGRRKWTVTNFATPDCRGVARTTLLSWLHVGPGYGSGPAEL